MSKYYYHDCHSLERMIEILKSGKIKTQRDLMFSCGDGFNGLDYVCVCNKCSDEEYQKPHINDAYKRYIKNGYCFIISDEVEAIKTEYLNYLTLGLTFEEAIQYSREHPENRWSDMIDEYQVYGSIRLKYIIGIGLPLDEFSEHISDYVIYYVEEIRNIIKISKELNLDIINTNDVNFIENYEREKNNNQYNKEKIYSGKIYSKFNFPIDELIEMC